MNTTTRRRNSSRPARPASQPQFDLIKRLLAEREIDARREALVAAARAEAVAGTLTTTGASALIDDLFAAPRREETEAAEAKPGFYVRGEEAFKVQQNKAGTHTYAKRWTGSSWEYAPGLGRSLADLVPMTAEQAAALGLASGRCINCLRTLGGAGRSAKVSAFIGYGETCARKNGWPYPKGKAEQEAYLAAREPNALPTDNCGGCEESDGEPHQHVSDAAGEENEPVEDPDACRGGKCDYANLHQCSRHSMEYQNRYGRAYNE